jgi:type I restriction enzyme R subunit
MPTPTAWPSHLNNRYADWCKAEGRARAEPYAFKCTSMSSGNTMVADLRGTLSSWFVATTVDLLSTGVDVPCVRNIVFFRYLESAIVFHQMVGRGTRIDEASGKLMFRLYDYTNMIRLFGRDFITPPPRPGGGGGGGDDPEPTLIAGGFEVHGQARRPLRAGRARRQAGAGGLRGIQAANWPSA